jgi:hypothetical protein
MAGVAWSGPNARSSRVGAYWAAIDNPHPEKKIRRIVVRAADEGDVYGLIAVSLSDQKHYVRPKGESFGGPDNWAAATAMAALIQGLAGITDSGVAYSRPVIAPRWVAAGVDSIGVTSRYPVSGGYVSYRFQHDAAHRLIRLAVTGNAMFFCFHVLLPDGVGEPGVTGEAGVTVQGGEAPGSRIVKVGASSYIDFVVPAARPLVEIRY